VVIGASLNRLDAAIRLADAWHRHHQLLASEATLGLQLFDDDRAAAWLCGSVAHADLRPARPAAVAPSLAA
jgi:hypothetical protein